MKAFWQRRWAIVVGVLLFGVFLSRVIALTELPIFADESIYIRWAQLIIDEPARYAFFAMNDGKTPLFIWMMIPFLTTFSDPLWAGRMVAVLAGVMQVWLLMRISFALGGNRVAAFASGLLGLVLPYWFFHQRMAIMDAWLTVWSSAALLGVINLHTISRPVAKAGNGLGKGLRELARDTTVITRILSTGLFLGAALLTKLPAVLVFPSIYVLLFFLAADWRQRLVSWVIVSVAIGVGFFVFALLALHPSFGQLFSRGGDFLYSPTEVLFEGKWQLTLSNSLRLSADLLEYIPLGVFVATASGMVVSPKPKIILGLFAAGCVFIAPIFLLGEVVYLRYLLPSCIFFTIAAAISFGQLLRTKPVWLMRSLALMCGLQILIVSVAFIYPSYTNADRIPFPHSDEVQYLEDWSSGHGIVEVIAAAQAESSQSNQLFIATEGFFGTLPDALMVYAYTDQNRPYRIEGIGQPVDKIPELVLRESAGYDTFWLVVNSHRLRFEIEEQYLLAEYCRPNNAPCLQLWDVTHLVK